MHCFKNNINSGPSQFAVRGIFTMSPGIYCVVQTHSNVDYVMLNEFKRKCNTCFVIGKGFRVSYDSDRFVIIFNNSDIFSIEEKY